MLIASHHHFVELVGGPQWGRQHLGYAPGGAQDRWSLRCGNLLLGNEAWTPALQMAVSPPTICFRAPARFVLSGASCRARLVDAQGEQRVYRHTVSLASAGAVLHLQPPTMGLRAYCCVEGGLEQGAEGFTYSCPGRAEPGRQRGAWGQVNGWAPPRGCLRVVPGPEFPEIDADAIVGPWRVLPASDAMGLRLSGPELPSDRYDLRSAPVADGTVQLTREGPIVLLRGRQTIGGYPRILQLIETDIDIAAQLRPHQAVRLLLADFDEARRAREQQAAELERLRQG